ncbi:hypothetical protein GCM10009639_44610 [Kitasatospora putterlickiae]|uniref:Uncharacterized protein n=1 Tax=Kitasatospora putterlickiae TaxID=221725 RepID=A0ABN1Y9T3_9ACTN
MNQDAVLRARTLLLSTDRRVLRGPRGLWAYRLLTRVSPEVYGSKLARVLVDATGFPEVSGLPEARLALLEEAVATARALDPRNPFRDRVLALALAAREAELRTR